jgi:tetratricopeptide (TPR) repeat protein
MWVFWVHASNADRFKQSYQNIAAQVELPGRDDPKTDILSAVHSWLCDERNGRWLVVVDNADDDLVFFSPGVDLGDAARGNESAEKVVPLASFLPQAATGWILVTSRDLVAAVNLVGARHRVIEVEAMGEQDALVLLRSKMQVDRSSEGDAKALVKALEGIPLAVTHAAAYIEVNKPMVDITTYLELFRESEENQASLLNSKDARDIRRDAGGSDAVITTWQLSFEQIRKTRSQAADLLSLMSMFDRQGIPEHVLYDGKTRLQFTEAVGPLLRFSLVRAQAREQSAMQMQEQLFEMHSLVQLATREWVKRHGQVRLWQRAALRIMVAAFPDGQHGTWATCQTLLPHSNKLLGYSMEEDDQAVLDQASVGTNTAWYLMVTGEYAKAERYGRSAVVAREKVLGFEHPDTLTSMAILASTYRNQGRWKEAEKMGVRVVEARKTTLGEKHSDTLTSMNNLANTYSEQGQWDDAEKLLVYVVEILKTKLMGGNPQMLKIMVNLASVYWNQGRWDEAKGLELQVMENSKGQLGAGHPDTLTAMNNLASTYCSQGRWKAAEELFAQVAEVRKDQLRADHPDTLISMVNLATTKRNQGRWADAEKLEVEMLRVRKNKLGADHPDTLMSMANLALTYLNQSRWDDAEKLGSEVLEARREKLGAVHPDTLTSMGNLASTYWGQERWDKAEGLEVEVLKARKNKLGADHPDTLTSMANLAAVYWRQDKRTDAEELEVAVLKARKQKLGADHPDTLMSMANLTMTYNDLGQWDAAEKLGSEVLQARKEKLGADHPDTLMSMAHLACVRKKQSRGREAVSLMEECVQLWRQSLGDDSPTFKSFKKALAQWKAEEADGDLACRTERSG